MLILDAKKVKQKKYSHVEMFKQIMLRNAERFHCRSIDQHKQSYNFEKLQVGCLFLDA